MTSIHEYSICFSTCVTQDGGEQEGLAPTVWSDVHIVTWYVNLIARNQAVGLVLAIKIWIDGRGMTLRRTDRRLVGTLITACRRPTGFLHANTHTHAHTQYRTHLRQLTHTHTDRSTHHIKQKKKDDFTDRSCRCSAAGRLVVGGLYSFCTAGESKGRVQQELPSFWVLLPLLLMVLSDALLSKHNV